MFRKPTINLTGWRFNKQTAPAIDCRLLTQRLRIIYGDGKKVEPTPPEVEAVRRDIASLDTIVAQIYARETKVLHSQLRHKKRLNSD